MLKRFGRWFLIAVLVLCVTTAGVAVAVTTLQQRSFTSWVVEQAMWVMGLKAESERIGQAGPDALIERQAADRVPLPVADVGSPIIEHTIDEMQVLEWGSDGTPTQPVIFYMHGGGYVNHAVSYTYRAAAAVAKQAGARVVMPIYPLAPKYTYTDAYPKVIAAYRHTLRSVQDPTQITIMGDSAGGGFALGLGQTLASHALAQPKRYVVFSPWVDARMVNDAVDQYEPLDPLLARSYLRVTGAAWAGRPEALDDPKVSPILGDFRGLAPVTIFMGTHELLLADLQSLEAALTTAGVPYRVQYGERMNHAYPLLPIPEADAALATVSELVRS